MKYDLINPVNIELMRYPMAVIFQNRNFTMEEAEHYLHTTDADILSPYLLDNINEGVELLIDCIANEKEMFIVPDVDADGFTSAAILINYIYAINPSYALNHIKYRINDDKTHGIILENIPEDTYLAVYPDSASNDYKQHRALKERGIKVLVIDHHDAPQVATDACVINNQLCDYPTKSLSGAGVVYKFCQALDDKLGENKANNFLDLVALGLISDMVSLKDFETKHLIQLGLSNIRNPFFKQMVAKNHYSLGETLTPVGIAFYVTPYINATIRVGSESEKQTLLESMLDFKAYSQIPSTKRGCKGQMETLVEQACRNCTNIKNKQNRARDASLERICDLIETKGLNENKILIIPSPKNMIDKNITGLIANQIMAKYNKPVILLREDETNILKGSARGVNQSEFSDLKTFCQESGYFSLAQGHAQAFGAEISKDSISDFTSYANQKLKDFTFTPCYKVDFILEGVMDCSKLICDIAQYKSLYGQGFEEPWIVVKNISVTKDNLTLMSKDKKPTLKIKLNDNWSLIRFKSSEEEYEKLYSETGCVKINVVGRCEQNHWNGRTTAQIIISDYEIVEDQTYYF